MKLEDRIEEVLEQLKSEKQVVLGDVVHAPYEEILEDGTMEKRESTYTYYKDGWKFVRDELLQSLKIKQ